MNMQTQTAKLNQLRIAPRKVRSVADLIRGLSVNDAEAQLSVVRRRPAPALVKLLRSAVANAKNKQLDVNHLFIKEIRVDQGPMLKRYLPRARGSASPLQRKMSNVTIVLGVNEKLQSKFTIISTKKKKLPKEPKADKEKPEQKRVTSEGPGAVEQNRKQGFFRRTFSGKSRAAK